MIRTSLYLTITCDTCDAPVTAEDRHGSPPAQFPDRDAALIALDWVLACMGWAHRAGRLLFPTCVGRADCRLHGHRYAADGWRLCACGRSIPTHTSTELDPVEWPGCWMAWRLCGRCDHIDEVHLTELDDDALTTVTDNAIAAAKRAVQPGGHLRQDVPAGLAPNHRQDSQETPMVEPTRPCTPNPAPIAPLGGAR